MVNDVEGRFCSRMFGNRRIVDFPAAILTAKVCFECDAPLPGAYSENTCAVPVSHCVVPPITPQPQDHQQHTRDTADNGERDSQAAARAGHRPDRPHTPCNIAQASEQMPRPLCATHIGQTRPPSQRCKAAAKVPQAWQALALRAIHATKSSTTGPQRAKIDSRIIRSRSKVFAFFDGHQQRPRTPTRTSNSVMQLFQTWLTEPTRLRNRLPATQQARSQRTTAEPADE